MAHRQQPHPPPSQTDQHQAEEIKEAKSAEIRSEQSNNGGSSAALGSSIGEKATPRVPARSKEQLAAIKIQTACRGYMVMLMHSRRERIACLFCFSIPLTNLKMKLRVLYP